MPDVPAAPTRSRLRLRVSPAAEAHVRAGHPWVYESSLRAQNRDGDAGELAVIYDRRDRFLAIGLFDPDSPLRVRVLHQGTPATLDDAWWAARLDEALLRRAPLFGPDTDGYRVVNGESDGFPGLVVDRYASTLVVKLYTAAWFPHLKRMLGLLAERFPEFALVLRLSRNIQARAREEGLFDGQLLAGSVGSGTVVFHETGLAFEAEVLRGQKTGFFLDQRDNRRLMRTFVQPGAGFLDVYSYTGGFSLHAAKAGAKAVAIDKDSVALGALEGAARGNALQVGVRWGDAIEQLDALVKEKRTFGAIVLDPPTLAKRRDDVPRTKRIFTDGAARALRMLDSGGYLLISTCAHYIRVDDLLDAARVAAAEANTDAEVLDVTYQPADHPHLLSVPESLYLKSILLRRA